MKPTVYKECITFSNDFADYTPSSMMATSASMSLLHGSAAATSSAGGGGVSSTGIKSEYVFDICYKLLGEIKDLNELNNQVLLSLCDFLLTRYKSRLSDEQTKELKILQLTARIFQVLVGERDIVFDSYKRHHSNPVLIIEQLLMNSHIELCSKTIKMCRDAAINDATFSAKINQTLVRYARKALEFRVYVQQKKSGDQLPPAQQHQQSTTTPKAGFISSMSGVVTASVSIGAKKRSDATSASAADMTSTSPPVSSAAASSLSSSFKNFYKFASSSTSAAAAASNSNNNLLLGINTPPNPNSGYLSSNMNLATAATTFIMPAIPPSKEEWVSC